MKSVNYSKVVVKSDLTVKTGEKTLDNFLSNDGGFVKKSAIFLTGTPGAGKTTLAIILQRLLKDFKTFLYSREMSASSIKNQMKRYEIHHENAYIADKEMCNNIFYFIDELNELMPKVVIIDSLQVIMKEDYCGISPEKSAFEIIQKLREWTNKNNAILIVIGHVNKDGEFEGKNTIQHMFDAHLEMIFDKKKNTRTISWAKNRFGLVGQTLYYEFGEESMEFYTKRQYDVLKNNKTFEEHIFEMIYNFLDSINKKSLNYNYFQKEFHKEMDELIKLNKNVFDINIEVLLILKKLLSKYQI